MHVTGTSWGAISSQRQITFAHTKAVYIHITTSSRVDSITARSYTDNNNSNTNICVEVHSVLTASRDRYKIRQKYQNSETEPRENNERNNKKQIKDKMGKQIHPLFCWIFNLWQKCIALFSMNRTRWEKFLRPGNSIFQLRDLNTTFEDGQISDLPGINSIICDQFLLLISPVFDTFPTKVHGRSRQGKTKKKKQHR